MNPLAVARFDWSGWRADVAERIDRCSITVAAALVAISSANMVFLGVPNDFATVALRTLWHASTVIATLGVLAVGMVVVTRGVSAWLAYPAAGLAAIAIGVVLGLVIDHRHWLSSTPSPPWHAMIMGHLYFLSFLVPPAVLYVYASTAARDAKVLRAAEVEQAAEAERLARERLQTELATVDHELVLKAMRLALEEPDPAAGQAQSLLDAVTAYLRAAHQRDSSEPGCLAAALNELKKACASRGGEPEKALA